MPDLSIDQVKMLIERIDDDNKCACYDEGGESLWCDHCQTIHALYQYIELIDRVASSGWRPIETAPSDRPDWPLPSFDAADWAEAFITTANKLVEQGANPAELLQDKAWLSEWFANALMRGYDEKQGTGGES